MANLFPLENPDYCYCDVIAYDPGQFNLTLRAYCEPDVATRTGYRYYLVEFFFTIFYSGPFFWQGMNASRGSDEELAALAPFALERKIQMRQEGQLHFPRLYHIKGDLGSVAIIAGLCRIYAHDSPEPLSISKKDGRWYANWPIIFEEGFPGSA